MKIKTIAIVGLGLMGGSLAAACRRKFPRSKIIGITRDASALAFAAKRGWIHKGFQDLKEAMKYVGAGLPRPPLKGAETAPLPLIVLCTPVDTFPPFLNLIERHSRDPVCVTDIGSVKGEILRWVGGRKWRHLHFVGAHPMVGTHEKGIRAATQDLYDGGFTFLVKGKATNPQSYRSVKAFWKRISPRVVELGAREHDRIVGEISHLPHAVAACLVLSPQKSSLPFAATGFRDTSRIAQGHPSVWLPIFQYNRRALLPSLAIFEKNLKQLRTTLARKQWNSLRRILVAAARRRGQI